MSRSWEDVRKSINEFFTVAADKTDEFIKVGKRKISIVEIKRNITSHYAELGGRVYHLIRQGESAGIGSDSEVESLVSRIQKLEDELKAKEIEIEQIRLASERAERKQEAAAGPAAHGSGESTPEAESSDSETPKYN
jgi:gas vesicle protein